MDGHKKAATRKLGVKTVGRLASAFEEQRFFNLASVHDSRVLDGYFFELWVALKDRPHRLSNYATEEHGSRTLMKICSDEFQALGTKATEAQLQAVVRQLQRSVQFIADGDSRRQILTEWIAKEGSPFGIELPSKAR